MLRECTPGEAAAEETPDLRAAGKQPKEGVKRTTIIFSWRWQNRMVLWCSFKIKRTYNT